MAAPSRSSKKPPKERADVGGKEAERTYTESSEPRRSSGRTTRGAGVMGKSRVVPPGEDSSSWERKPVCYLLRRA